MVLDSKIQLNSKLYQECELCPRLCRVDRTRGHRGICGATDLPRVSRSALHHWEEPPISGTAGSGTIFFSGCTLRCVFCQNYEISRGEAGLEVSISRLAQMMLELQEQGAHNINLVTPMHYAPSIALALNMAKDAGLHIPIVCNTGGFERPEIIEAFAPYIDIWLADFKYSSSELAQSFSYAREYPENCRKSLQVMLDAVDSKGGRLLDAEGIMQRGVIVRHLVLPSHTSDSIHILDELWDIAQNKIDLSIMNQYTPNAQCLKRNDELSRVLTEGEYNKVLTYAQDLGFERIWWQENGTQSESFIPAFDYTGVRGPEIPAQHDEI